MKRILILLSLFIASPAFAQTYVDTSSTQTLTNKTLSAPTITGASTLASPAFTGTPTFAGSSSGTTGLAASATASGTLTLPATTDTLVGKATTDTFTNKTLTSPVITGMSATGTETIGAGMTITSPALVSPTLSGTPVYPANTFRSWIGGSSAAVVSNAVANFFPFSGNGTAVAATSEGDVSQIEAVAGTLKNMTCILTTIAGVVTVAGGTNYVMALRQNIASSAMTCTIASGASSCTDTTHTITTAINDQLDYIDTPSGTPTALVVHCSAEKDI